MYILFGGYEFLLDEDGIMRILFSPVYVSPEHYNVSMDIHGVKW